MVRQLYLATPFASVFPAMLASTSLLTHALGYEDGAVERRLSTLRAGKEDEWRELWVWGYSFMVVVLLFIAPRLSTKKKFPWSIRERELKFLTVRRSFEKFCHFKDPALPKASFQHPYRKSRPFLYFRILKTALLRGHSFILASGALALLLSWFLRSAYYIHYKNSFNVLLPEVVRANFAAGGVVYKIVVPLNSFVMTIYLVFYVSRLYDIMDLAWKVQGRIYDVAILIGTLLMPHCEDERVQHACWEVHRYLNLGHLLAYEEISDSVKNETDNIKTLTVSGFLAESEQAEFSAIKDCRFMIVFVWLSDLTSRLVEANVVPRVFSASILEALGELSDAILEFQCEVTRGPPRIVKHMMHYMADMMCIFTPAMLAAVFHQNDPSSPTYFWPWAGSMVVAFFYQGIIRLCQALEMPFRDHWDGLDPDWALMETERQTSGCLYGHQPAYLDSMNLMQPAGTASLLVEASELRPSLLKDRSFDDAATNAAAIDGAESHFGGDFGDLSVGTTFLSPVLTQIGHGRKPSALLSRRQSSKEKVPLEAVPDEAPLEARDFNLDDILGATTIGHVAYAERTQHWGQLNPDILQATRAALLVPREITLDDETLERLESVTARPLSELAAALLNVEPGSIPADALMLTQGPDTEGHKKGAGGSHADELKELFAQYHGLLHKNSDIRAQVAAAQSGLKTFTTDPNTSASQSPSRGARNPRASRASRVGTI